MKSGFNQKLEYLESSHWVWDTVWSCPYQIRVEPVGAWLAVPQTQRNHLID